MASRAGWISGSMARRIFLNVKASTEGRRLFSVMAKRIAAAAGEDSSCSCGRSRVFGCPDDGVDAEGGRREDDGADARPRRKDRVDIRFRSEVEENRPGVGARGGGDESWVRDDVRDSAGVYVLTITGCGMDDGIDFEEFCPRSFRRRAFRWSEPDPSTSEGLDSPIVLHLGSRDAFIQILSCSVFSTICGKVDTTI